MRATTIPTHSSLRPTPRTRLRVLSSRAVAGVCTAVAATLSACSDPAEPGPKIQLLGQVEEVSVQSSVQVDEPLDVGLRGSLGPDLCFLLDRVDVAEVQSGKELRVIVEDATPEDGACPAQEATFDTIVTLAPPHSAPLELRIIQRVGPPIVRQIEVVM